MINVIPLCSTEGAGGPKDSFVFRFIRFKFNKHAKKFEPILFNIKNSHKQIIKAYARGLTSGQVQASKLLYGPCEIHVPRKSIPRLLIDEVLSPFHLFQWFSMILWFWDDYANYATCIGLISLWGICQNLYDCVKNINNVRNIARFECKLKVQRIDEEFNALETKSVSSTELVPGDVVHVPDNCLLPCDLVLLQGQCVVNESMLTGESVPVIKSSLDQFSNNVFDPNDNLSKRHSLYSGTKVI